jgi:hypothetical protein
MRGAKSPCCFCAPFHFEPAADFHKTLYRGLVIRGDHSSVSFNFLPSIVTA